MKAKLLLILVLISVVILIVSGCGTIQSVAKELGSCTTKCGDLCILIQENDFDLGNFTVVGLTKRSGNSEVTCSCSCKN